jgi:hypothetical protein
MDGSSSTSSAEECPGLKEVSIVTVGALACDVRTQRRSIEVANLSSQSCRIFGLMAEKVRHSSFATIIDMVTKRSPTPCLRQYKVMDDKCPIDHISTGSVLRAWTCMICFRSKAPYFHLDDSMFIRLPTSLFWYH